MPEKDVCVCIGACVWVCVGVRGCAWVCVGVCVNGRTLTRIHLICTSRHNHAPTISCTVQFTESIYKTYSKA